MNKTKTLLVMAGGTGGHVFPGLAVANKLKEEGWQVSWLGTAARMEARLVPEHGYEIDFIDVVGVRGNGIKRLLAAPFQVIKSIFQARKVLKKRNVDLVLGMGGFASGPGGIAAWTMGIPVVLHEQNATAGLTNRILSYFSKKVLMGFSGAFSGEKAVLVGNPIRKDLLDLPEKVFSTPEQALKVLVIGGSLGARVLNETVPDALLNFDARQVSVLHQTGKGFSESVTESYQQTQVDYQVQEFISDMASAYQWADLIICRAGALTVAEVAVVGLPAIFVPLPHAVDDHQTKNAQSLVSADAAILIAQKELDANKLSECLMTLSQNRLLLNEMSQNCKNIAIREATQQVTDVCLSLVSK
ncbi:undecaprenyldiphospho-muramoylpentapeptide beta-N-acetylglucosaminyltransferase [Psychromonas sp. B3M02]|uniref:undecaprenyldiphospho-muramoylpentapeptide beta-N-acetylglucosaminyltransferase n=1 Tax=Psychromonas sp. B3M02 TaxID=2267226 RepID=UPI000DEA8F3D|nr:undecaprenyldiphospho-muramoylpentapeptide beta-N-acetylglucosaminyltransferase [Psychromonas sp. B3M02]RBW44544.1 undecaprenyldiphospho-muramoylpentapeptide beta-N-acetylglucosaminyltransferase [Psychromonas sp. B3M02]